jgi:hypothetical protein
LIHALVLLGCGGGAACDEGQVRRAGQCVDYTAGPPATAGDVWRPAPGTTWQWQLTGAIDSSLVVDMYDVDLFDVPDATLADLAERAVVICYFSAGSFEDWRPDAAAFPDDALGDPLDGWDGEWWLDVTHPAVRAAMVARLDLAVARGCDGVEPDNVDGYANPNGVGLNATEQLEYNRFLADEAHKRGLSVGLKNDLEQAADLVAWFDWALNEECAAYDECSVLSAFTGASKAAFHVEYVDDFADAPALADQVCGVGPDLDTLIKEWDLGPQRLACP